MRVERLSACAPGGVGVALGVAVAPGVGVGEARGVTDGVEEGLTVGLGLTVGNGDGLGEPGGVGGGVSVGIGEGVIVGVGVGLGPGVGEVGGVADGVRVRDRRLAILGNHDPVEMVDALDGLGFATLVNQSTTLLVFRNQLDTNPQVLTTSQDSGYLQGLENGEMGYSHGIGVANRDFIVSHYRAYGGPEPPEIDHHGIDDAFLEKASIVWYFHEGKWLQLAGAD